MLFDRKIEPCCAYCRFGQDMGGGQTACVKRGVVESCGSCRRFKYDPIKRIPCAPAPVGVSDLTPEDFSLE